MARKAPRRQADSAAKVRHASADTPVAASSLETLEFILGSQPTDRFVSEVLGQRFLHCPCPDNDSERFSRILPIDVLDSVLGTYGLKVPDIRLIQADRDIEPSAYEWRNGLVDPLRVARFFSDGATVVFERLQDRHEPLRKLCAGLARESSGYTQTNVYLTPPHSQGFKPHWDTHDVFVLQVSGSKDWSIYRGGPDNPLPHDAFDPGTHRVGPLEANLTLSAGETLYVPRGAMHAAETRDEISVHVTLGLKAYSWADLLAACVLRLTGQSPRWRRNLPFGFGHEIQSGFPAVRAEFEKMLGTVPYEVDLAGVLAAHLDQVGAEHRPRAGDFLSQVTLAADLDEDHIVERRPDLALRIETLSDRIVIHCGRRLVSFPLIARPTVEAVLGDGPSRAGDIDDGLDWSSRRVVLATLMREGLLTRKTLPRWRPSKRPV